MANQRATATAHANIAVVKYWGVADSALTLPYNESVSMNLDHCTTTTTVAFDGSLPADEVGIAWFGREMEEVTGQAYERVVAQLDRVRMRAGIEEWARVESANTFPADAGIASSASAFAALTTAAAGAAGLQLGEHELSILTRRSGSGSACRSIPPGFVHWRNDGTDAGSYAVSVAMPNDWALADVVAIVDTGPKSVGSAENHRLAVTSPYFKVRLQEVPARVNGCLRAIREHELATLGLIAEADAVSLHVVAMTAQPPTFYWRPGTLRVMQAVHDWRKEGFLSYWTMDAGANVHVLCAMSDAPAVAQRLEALPEVQFTITNGPGPGAYLHAE
ncbi:MAG: diphosphomevalonate decarboxylase [Herpetosiphonaceae bacterium]|nr:diphosphomevalonate decarboxylase [Herpetosiphonaceae bacterium]